MRQEDPSKNSFSAVAWKSTILLQHQHLSSSISCSFLLIPNILEMPNTFSMCIYIYIYFFFFFNCTLSFYKTTPAHFGYFCLLLSLWKTPIEPSKSSRSATTPDVTQLTHLCPPLDLEYTSPVSFPLVSHMDILDCQAEEAITNHGPLRKSRKRENKETAERELVTAGSLRSPSPGSGPNSLCVLGQIPVSLSFFLWLCWVSVAVWASSSCSKRRLISGCGVLVSHSGGFPGCSEQAQ